MTICIAAIGDNCKAVVVAADRMVTVGNPMNLEFEHDFLKIERVGTNIMAMSSGNALLSTEIIGRIARAPHESQVLQFGEVLNQLSEQFVAVRQKKIEESIFLPIGITHERFIADGNKIFPSQVFMAILQQTGSFNLGYEVLLAGVDQSGAHIAHVHNPALGVGISAVYDHIGYHAIGSGSIHSALALILRGHSMNHTLTQTIFKVYSAKKAAEVAPGVGRETDLMIIRGSGAYNVPDNVMEVLDGLAETVQPPDLSNLEKGLNSINGLKS